LEHRARLGISRIALVSGLIVVVAVAGLAVYLAVVPPGPSKSTTSTSEATSTQSASLVVGLRPPSPLIAPGQTQNYSSIELQTLGSGLNGTLAIIGFSPPGISLLLNKSSVSLANDPQSIRLGLKADTGLTPGKYNFSLETSSADLPARNQTFTIDVVPVLVIIQSEAFHPQNITVHAGTPVSWINLDSTIGCCDPGNHNVVFLSGANGSSPILKQFDSWSYQFGTPGVVEYYCSIHPLIMKGQVTVTA